MLSFSPRPIQATTRSNLCFMYEGLEELFTNQAN